MTGWGMDFSDGNLESGRNPHVESFKEPVLMTKNQKLIILRGLNAKAGRLRELTREHLNAEGWDTEQHGKDASKLCDEMSEMLDVLRTELQ